MLHILCFSDLPMNKNGFLSEFISFSFSRNLCRPYLLKYLSLPLCGPRELTECYMLVCSLTKSCHLTDVACWVCLNRFYTILRKSFSHKMNQLWLPKQLLSELIVLLANLTFPRFFMQAVYWLDLSLE